MTYKAKKPVKPCPRCGSPFTINRNGSVRKHPEGPDVCSQVPDEPQRRPRKRVSAAESRPASVSARVPSTVNDMDLSPAMVRALHYWAAPDAVQRQIPLTEYFPSNRTRVALLDRELLDTYGDHDEYIRINAEGLRVARRIEPLKGTPRLIAEHWRAAQTVANTEAAAPSSIVLPSKDRLMSAIMYYGELRVARSASASSRLNDIRKVLAVLYREAGRE